MSLSKRRTVLAMPGRRAGPATLLSSGIIPSYVSLCSLCCSGTLHYISRVGASLDEYSSWRPPRHLVPDPTTKTPIARCHVDRFLEFSSQPSTPRKNRPLYESRLAWSASLTSEAEL